MLDIADATLQYWCQWDYLSGQETAEIKWPKYHKQIDISSRYNIKDKICPYITPATGTIPYCCKGNYTLTSLQTKRWPRILLLQTWATWWHNSSTWPSSSALTLPVVSVHAEHLPVYHLVHQIVSNQCRPDRGTPALAHEAQHWDPMHRSLTHYACHAVNEFPW